MDLNLFQNFPPTSGFQSLDASQQNIILIGLGLSATRPTATGRTRVPLFVGSSPLLCLALETLPVAMLSPSSHVVNKGKKVKWSRYRPGVAQRMGRGIALLFHDRGTRRWWVVSSTPRPHFTPGKDSVPILQEIGWATGPVWTGGKSRPNRDSIPDRPARCQSLYGNELKCC